MRIGHSDGLRYVNKLACSIIDPYTLLLVAGKAAPVHCGPVLGIADDGGIAAGNFGEVVPVTLFAVERDVAVGEEEIERTVIVQVAELCAEAPSAKLYTHVACEVLILNVIA